MVADEESQVVGHVAGGGGFQSDALETASPQGKPLVLGHFLEQDLLGGGGGQKFVVEIGDEQVELLAVFAVDEKDGAGKTIGKSILGGSGFPCRGGWPAGSLGVLAIGVDLGLSSHVDTDLLWRVLTQGERMRIRNSIPRMSAGRIVRQTRQPRSNLVIAQREGKTFSESWK